MGNPQIDETSLGEIQRVYKIRKEKSMYILFSIICQFFICICYSLSLYYLAVVILDRKPEKRCFFIFCVTFTVTQIFTNLIYASVYDAALESTKLFSFVWNILLYSGYATILVSLIVHIYHTDAAQTVVATAISHFAVFTISLLVTEYMGARVFPDDNFIVYMLLTTVLPIVSGLAGAVLIARLLKRWKFHQYFRFFFIKRKRAAIVTVSSVVLMHYHTIIELIVPVEIGSPAATLYSGIFIILMIFALQFAAIYNADKEKIKAQSDTIAQMQIYLTLLEELQQEVRSFRHDFTNLLAGASMQAAEGDLEGIQEFMQNTGSYFDEKLGNEIRYLECISNIKIYSLQSLITTKITKMQEQGIAYLLEVPNPVIECGMRTEDLLRCIGILIDNAWEAAVGSDEKAVKMVLLQTPGELFATVSNTWAQKPDLVKMQKKGYSSKGKNRGTGLSSLRKITGEYPNCMTRMRVENNMFIQELRIIF